MPHRLTLAFIFAFLLVFAGAVSAQTLKPGDDAPALSVSKWLNGKEVAKFEKGTVYVIECWATWCGPCVQSMPHVSALNTKMKDKNVVVIGLNVWERDKSKVEPFIKKMGDKLNFVVAVDNGQSAKDWLEAAKQDGIPCSFVVDKEGKIAWIGHPMDGLDKVVEAVVAGTFDAKEHAKQEAEGKKKQAGAAKRVKALERQLKKAGEAEDWDTVLATYDKIAAELPEAKAAIAVAKFGVLSMQKKDFPAAYALAKKYLETDLKDDARALNEVAWFILTEEELEQRDFDVALAIAQRAAQVTKFEDAAILDTLARACFEKKDVDKAIEYQAKAIEKAGSEDEESLNEMKAALIRYKSSKVQ